MPTLTARVEVTCRSTRRPGWTNCGLRGGGDGRGGGGGGGGGADNAIAFLVQFNIIRYNKKQKDKTQGIHRPQQRSDGFQKTGIDETHARAPP